MQVAARGCLDAPDPKKGAGSGVHASAAIDGCPATPRTARLLLQDQAARPSRCAPGTELGQGVSAVVLEFGQVVHLPHRATICRVCLAQNY